MGVPVPINYYPGTVGPVVNPITYFLTNSNAPIQTSFASEFNVLTRISSQVQSAFRVKVPIASTVFCGYNVRQRVQAPRAYPLMSFNSESLDTARPVVAPLSWAQVLPAFSWAIDSRRSATGASQFNTLFRVWSQGTAEFPSAADDPSTRQSLFNTTVRVTGSQKASRFNALKRITGSSRQSLFNTLKHVLTSRASAFNTLSRRSPTVSIAWRNQFGAVTSTLSSLFNVHTRVVKQQSSAFNTRQRVTSTRQSLFNTMALVFVRSTKAVAWNVQSRVRALRTALFDTTARVTGSSKQSLFNARQRIKPQKQVLFNTDARTVSQKSSAFSTLARHSSSRSSGFSTLARVSSSKQSLFNVNLVKAPVTSSFNTLARRQGSIGVNAGKSQASAFSVYVRVSTAVTMEWNVGKPEQINRRLIPTSRWIPMYPS